MAINGTQAHGETSLGQVANLIDWTELDRLLACISASTKGEPGWPPLALFRALLLAMWHDLSDVRLAEALDDRGQLSPVLWLCRAQADARAHRLCPVPRRAGAPRPGPAPFEAVTRQLDARGVVVRTGTLVDATLIASASVSHDGEAKWAGHRRRKPVHGYKAHVATDQDAGADPWRRSHDGERA